MKFNGDNINEVLEAHRRWFLTGGENDDDRADFEDANLHGWFLPGIFLWGANLRGVNFQTACLYCADLTRADLTGANFMGADLNYCKLRGAINVPHIPSLCPETGSFIGYKRVKAEPGTPGYDGSLIVKLLIPEDAKRSSDTNNECRASKAVVLEVQSMDGEVLHGVSGYSIFDRGKTVYTPGAVVDPGRFEEDRFNHWGPGVFFYLNRQSAVEYLTFGTDKYGNIRQVNIEDIERDWNARNDWNVVGKYWEVE